VNRIPMGRGDLQFTVEVRGKRGKINSRWGLKGVVGIGVGVGDVLPLT
jgi:hypothetical protein